MDLCTAGDLIYLDRNKILFVSVEITKDTSTS
jgi:hypothetical protein